MVLLSCALTSLLHACLVRSMGVGAGLCIDLSTSLLVYLSACLHLDLRTRPLLAYRSTCGHGILTRVPPASKRMQKATTRRRGSRVWPRHTREIMHLAWNPSSDRWIARPRSCKGHCPPRRATTPATAQSTALTGRVMERAMRRKVRGRPWPTCRSTWQGARPLAVFLFSRQHWGGERRALYCIAGWWPLQGNGPARAC